MEGISMHGCKVKHELGARTIQHFPENSASLLKQLNIKEKKPKTKRLHMAIETKHLLMD